MRGRIYVPLMLVSVLISVLLWFVVFGQSLPAPEPIALKVNLINLDTQKWLIDNDRTPARVRVKFFAPAASLEEVKDREPTIDVDLTDAKPGTNRYAAELNPSGYQSLLLSKALFVQVTVDPIAHRAVPIRVSREGLLKDDHFTIAEMRLSREVADVSGPADVVSKVAYCRAWFNLADVDPTNPSPQSATLAALGADDTPYAQVRIDPVQVAITPLVSAAPTERTALVVPVFIGQPAPGFLPGQDSIEPPTVQVTGDPALLADSSSISTEPMNVQGIMADKEFRVRLRVPRNLKLKGRNVIRVVYRVRPDPNAHAGETHPAPPTSTFPSTVPPLNGEKGGSP